MSSTVFVNGVTLTAASWFQDVDNVAYQYLSGVAGTNTITATGPAGLGAYAAGLKFRFIPAATNTGATTINITGTAALGARSIFSGGTALTGGELVVGVPCEIVDDGTQFHILSGIFYKQGLWTPSIGGNATYTTQVGNYTKVGRVVFVRCSLQINVIGTGSTTAVSGLPFTSSSGASSVFSIDGIGALATAVVSLQGSLGASSTTINIGSRTVASTVTSSNAIFASGASITISGSYDAA